MQPKAQDLLVLSLALEESLAREDWSTADALLTRRQGIIESLEGEHATPAADQLAAIRDVETRIVLQLNEGRRDIIASLNSASKGRDMIRAYRAA